MTLGDLWIIPIWITFLCIWGYCTWDSANEPGYTLAIVLISFFSLMGIGLLWVSVTEIIKSQG